MFLVFPFQSTLSLMQNDGVNYYTNSLVTMFFILGIVTKPWMLPLHMGAGVGMTSLGWFLYHGWDGRLASVCFPAQVNAMFAGLVTSSVMVVLENNHRRITEAEVALAKAAEEKAQAAEIAKAYGELKKREELIRVYVRPSLVDEIRAGNDPSQAPPVLRNLSIMFCDIRDFTRLTEVLTPHERQTFLNRYFAMMTEPIARNGGEVDKIMGDCVMGLFPDGASAVGASVAMRLELQAFNAGMYRSGAALIRNGIGIAKGEVMQANFGSAEKLDRTVIGEAVNIAARLEAKTKMYNLEVVVTEDVIRDLPPGTGHYRWIDVVQVKGSSRHLKVYEIYGHQPEQVRRFKDDTREMFEKALTIYFQKGFKDAARLFRAMLANVPPHRLVQGQSAAILHRPLRCVDERSRRELGSDREMGRGPRLLREVGFAAFPYGFRAGMPIRRPSRPNARFDPCTNRSCQSNDCRRNRSRRGMCPTQAVSPLHPSYNRS
jgi:class 3 adenylate cyclase